MNNTQTDIQSALDNFYVRCPFTRITVADDFINYKTSGGEHGNAYALDVAERIISECLLPLKAEIIGFPIKNILQITSK